VFRPENASITTVEFSGHERRVVAFDDRAHLARAASPSGWDHGGVLSGASDALGDQRIR
jgi:hypothetical protein